MRRIFGLFSIVAVALTVVLAGPVPAGADGGVPKPDLWRGKGDKCLEPATDMRRYHMNYLKHQRNDTMYQGIRGTKYSMKKCIECHAVQDPNDKESHVRSVEHFCDQCHEYAAVWIDCFDCHAHDLPEDGTMGGTGK